VSKRNLLTSLLALIAGLTIGVIVNSAIVASLTTLLAARPWRQSATFRPTPSRRSPRDSCYARSRAEHALTRDLSRASCADDDDCLAAHHAAVRVLDRVSQSVLIKGQDGGRNLATA
jgi:hypothetical protein